jgi:hypothetical protein
MADRLTTEEQRWRAAIRARRFDEARTIRRRVEQAMDAVEAESRAAAPRRRKAARTAAPPPARGDPDSVPPTPANGWVRHTILAHELGIDERSLWHRIEDEPFAKKFSERIKLVNRSKFYAWLETHDLRMK